MDHPELATINDNLGDALHDQLDIQVNNVRRMKLISKAFGSDLESESSDLEDFLQLVAGHLLDAIIEHSNGYLNKPYKNEPGHAIKFIQATPLLLLKLHEAWGIKKYCSIRLLRILQAEAPRSPAVVDHKFLLDSFRAPFAGAAVNGLYEYLETNERLFKETYAAAPYYAKFCSMVQSSGTGKSRTLIELSKKNVVVLYMNLREKDEETAFPCRDPIPSNILCGEWDLDEYTNVCYAFLGALFAVLERYLASAHGTHPGNAVADWTKKMCDMDPSNDMFRVEYFRAVEATHNEYLDRIRAKSGALSRASDVEKTAENFQNLSLSESRKGGASSDRQIIMLEAYHALGKCLETIISGAPPSGPRLVIAIDEAHTLSNVRSPVADPFRPADVLARLINKFSHTSNKHAIWVIFASTTSRVADFSPPNQKHNSLRVAIHGHQLFRPYTQLGWDQQATPLGQVNVDDIAEVNHILTFGRPLWKSLVGNVTGPTGLLNTASKKLCGEERVFDPAKVAHVLAVVGQRFGLDVTLGHPESIAALETAVASHLRICLATTLDRHWRYTSYPSEPFLSCAAARLLHAHADHLVQALRTLGNRIKEGMVNIGERGELTSRLLWLLAKDLFVRRHPGYATEGLVAPDNPTRVDSWQYELLDCQMIPVTDWLEFVFGERVFGQSDSEEERQSTRDSFKGTYVNFSHWTSMDALVAGSANDLPLDEWTLRHFQRTSAVQCCHNQPLVDKVIPICFKGAGNTPAESNQMSQIFISDKNRQSSSEGDLNKITRQHQSLGGYPSTKDRNNSPDDHPYIAILVDLGLLAPKFSATFPTRNVTDPCLRIYAAGIGVDTYPFLRHYPGLLLELQNLARLEQQPESEQRYARYLDAQVRFGKTPTAKHMKWEHGKTVPQTEAEGLAG